MIKVILIACVVAAGWMLYRGPGSATQRAFRRLIALALAVVGVFFILFPEALTWIANVIGVGRGADLLLYAFVVAFCFVSVGIYQRMFALEKRLELLTRELALRSPRETAADITDE